MSVRQFLDVVPKSVKTVAAVIAGGGVLIGLAGTFIESGGGLPDMAPPFHVLYARRPASVSCGGRGDRNLDSLPGLCECRCSPARHATHPMDAHRSVHP